MSRGDRNRCTKQKRMAEDLMIEAGLEGHTGKCSLDELKLLHATNSLCTYRIEVIELNLTGMS